MVAMMKVVSDVHELRVKFEQSPSDDIVREICQQSELMENLCARMDHTMDEKLNIIEPFMFEIEMFLQCYRSRFLHRVQREDIFDLQTWDPR
jgi:hypothetical protein